MNNTTTLTKPNYSANFLGVSFGSKPAPVPQKTFIDHANSALDKSASVGLRVAMVALPVAIIINGFKTYSALDAAEDRDRSQAALNLLALGEKIRDSDKETVNKAIEAAQKYLDEDLYPSMKLSDLNPFKKEKKDKDEDDKKDKKEEKPTAVEKKITTDTISHIEEIEHPQSKTAEQIAAESAAEKK